jgi:hypothetical protein
MGTSTTAFRTCHPTTSFPVLIRTLTLDTIVVNTAEVTLVERAPSISDPGLGAYNVTAAISESIRFAPAQGAARD